MTLFFCGDVFDVFVGDCLVASFPLTFDRGVVVFSGFVGVPWIGESRVEPFIIDCRRVVVELLLRLLVELEMKRVLKSEAKRS